MNLRDVGRKRVAFGDVCVVLRGMISIVDDLLKCSAGDKLRMLALAYRNAKVIWAVEPFLSSDHIAYPNNMISSSVDIPLHRARAVEYKGEISISRQLDVPFSKWTTKLTLSFQPLQFLRHTGHRRSRPDQHGVASLPSSPFRIGSNTTIRWRIRRHPSIPYRRRTLNEL